MNRKGFTLVEILIVVIILGILAAVVIPQFTEASNDARASALASDLQMVRAQCELYKVQHLERYPNLDDAGVIDAAVGNFVLRLTGKTDHTGLINAAGNLGPYMHKFPTNPYTQTDTLLFGIVAPPRDNSSGWWFNTANGKLSANDDITPAGM